MFSRKPNNHFSTDQQDTLANKTVWHYLMKIVMNLFSFIGLATV